MEKIYARQKRQWKFELQLHEKSLVDKQKDLDILQHRNETTLQDRMEIEVNTMMEGFRSILKTKYFNEWR